MKHVNEPPRPPSARAPGIPADLDRVVVRALAKNPAERYQSAEELDSDLARVEAGLPVARETARRGDGRARRRSTAPTQVLRPTQVPPQTSPRAAGRPTAAALRPLRRDRKRRKRSFLPSLVVGLLLAAFAAAGLVRLPADPRAAPGVGARRGPERRGRRPGRAVERLEADGLRASTRSGRTEQRRPAGRSSSTRIPRPGSGSSKDETVTIIVSTGVPAGRGAAASPACRSSRRPRARSTSRPRMERPRGLLGAGTRCRASARTPSPASRSQGARRSICGCPRAKNLIDVPNVVGQSTRRRHRDAPGVRASRSQRPEPSSERRRAGSSSRRDPSPAAGARRARP